MLSESSTEPQNGILTVGRGTASDCSDPEQSGDELSSRGESCSAAEQDTSDNSDKLIMESGSSNNGDRTAANPPLSQPADSEDYVNNNKENGGFHPANWLLQQPLQPPPRLAVTGLRRRRGGSEEEEEDEGRDSEEKSSEESEEDKYSSSPRLLLDRDLNMNRGGCDTAAPKGGVTTNPSDFELGGQPHPLVDQLRAVTERIGQLVSEAGRADNPRTLQDLAVLQTTLFSLQQQQLLQMQILAHMQNHMKTDEVSVPPTTTARSQEQQQPGSRLLATKAKEEDEEETRQPRKRNEEEDEHRGRMQQQPPLRKLQDLIGAGDRSVAVAKINSHPLHQQHRPDLNNSRHNNNPAGNGAGPFGTAVPHLSASEEGNSYYPQGDNRSPFTANILAPGDQQDHAHSPLNSLELLQQKAQGILNNASHGLLKNSLADLSYSKSASKDDPHFKHRCKFCGKVFGSDSALQIHIRYWRELLTQP